MLKREGIRGRECGEGVGTCWTPGAKKEVSGLQQQEGWTLDRGSSVLPLSLQLSFSEGPMSTARKGAVCLQCGTSCVFGSWALDGEECGGQLASRWESSLVEMTGMLASIVVECPRAPGHTVCSEEGGMQPFCGCL